MTAPVNVTVTGATKGIGLATAQRLGAAGVRVVLGAHERGSGEAAVAALAAQGVAASTVQLDVTDDDSVRAAAELDGAGGPAAPRAGTPSTCCG